MWIIYTCYRVVWICMYVCVYDIWLFNGVMFPQIFLLSSKTLTSDLFCLLSLLGFKLKSLTMWKSFITKGITICSGKWLSFSFLNLLQPAIKLLTYLLELGLKLWLPDNTVTIKLWNHSLSSSPNKSLIFFEILNINRYLLLREWTEWELPPACWKIAISRTVFSCWFVSLEFRVTIIQNISVPCNVEKRLGVVYLTKKII